MARVWTVIGWIAWVAVVYLAITRALGCRRYARDGKPFAFITATQTTYLWVVATLFLCAPVSKLHILWIVPLISFWPLCYYMQSTFPVLLFTRLLMKVVLLGIESPLRASKALLDPPTGVYSTPLSAVLKAWWSPSRSVAPDGEKPGVRGDE